MPRQPNEFYGNIEAPIRKLVKLLRDHGWNTTCSCGHGMWVELDFGNNLDDAERLARFLQERGYRHFYLEACVFVAPKALWVRRGKVYLGEYTPADNVTAKELTAKIINFKEENETFHQENYRLRERLKKLHHRGTGGVSETKL